MKLIALFVIVLAAIGGSAITGAAAQTSPPQPQSSACAAAIQAASDNANAGDAGKFEDQIHFMEVNHCEGTSGQCTQINMHWQDQIRTGETVKAAMSERLLRQIRCLK